MGMVLLLLFFVQKVVDQLGFKKKSLDKIVELLKYISHILYYILAILYLFYNKKFPF